MLATAFGLIVGSFLNVVVLRMRAGRNFVTGRSSCPHCGHTLRWYDMVPVVSWVVLRGRCRDCRKPVSWQYPAVELLTGLVFGLSFALAEFRTIADVITFALWLYIAGSLIVLAIYDLRWYLLPDKVLLPLIVPATAILIGSAANSGSLAVLWKPVLAGLAFGGVFYLAAAVSDGKWMGGGDIKLAFVMGLLLGIQKTALAMLIAFNAAAIIGLFLIAIGRKKRSEHIPFGPFLIAGTFVAYWFGVTIIDWYLHITGADLL